MLEMLEKKYEESNETLRCRSEGKTNIIKRAISRANPKIAGENPSVHNQLQTETAQLMSQSLFLPM